MTLKKPATYSHSVSFAYDEVPYDTEANPEAHPRSMATLAHLFGVNAATPSTSRVLEIGCGDGEHMIAAASYLPRARFVGFDLAADAIARGVGAARRCGADNAVLLHRDVRDVRASGVGQGEAGAPASFDYVIAHGVYSWVPEPIRADVLAVIRSALAPAGIGFVSVNALPGWELRRALRILMREAADGIEDPAERVRAALALVDDLAGARGGGFVGVLAKAADEYRAHVAQATPPDVPFSRYLFHDLLAECNDPFGIDELGARLRAAGLRILCESPLRTAAVAAAVAQSGSPFLQVLVCRDDATPLAAPTLDAVRTMHLWADLTPAGAGAFRTTTGAVMRTTGEHGLARAARSAPGFVAVSTLTEDDEALARLESDLFASACAGHLTIATEPAPIRGVSATPRVAPHVRQRARDAVAAGAKTTVLTSALHRSFRVPQEELVIIAELDGKTGAEAIRERAGVSADQVAKVLDRFARYGFLLQDEEEGA